MEELSGLTDLTLGVLGVYNNMNLTNQVELEIFNNLRIIFPEWLSSLGISYDVYNCNRSIMSIGIIRYTIHEIMDKLPILPIGTVCQIKYLMESEDLVYYYFYWNETNGFYKHE